MATSCHANRKERNEEKGGERNVPASLGMFLQHDISFRAHWPESNHIGGWPCAHLRAGESKRERKVRFWGTIRFLLCDNIINSIL